jgi:hypothetical protein
MVDCFYCHKEIKKDDEFVLVGKYPSTMEKWKLEGTAVRSPESFGTIYHKSCYVEMTNKGKS